ncbi:hypothetical protein HRS9139_08189 [Pyrenophora teres f. teres]|uniref:Uncharacterized protein n=1 Tax=Pyrenophora teres f. teres TaxID=97479 RepID=A0A6S6WFP4_9PLEO|nr:hypothetical protein HRS9139_08189 [Pyrenophora teres f. teres]KAE8856196.1 hypothetical protein PTNB29_09035 [Pyrenophora teres f. teres]CAE7214364.1 hypothetical protein PTTW11_10544 [Pyrenophora teres f. teres]
MKLILLSLLPAALAANPIYFTNDGWGKPTKFNSDACQNNPAVHYFCATPATTTGKNPNSWAFPHRRENCVLADTQGNACKWRGADGIIICC